jgi:drug/metabolite transporter (DMT)-like permease
LLVTTPRPRLGLALVLCGSALFILNAGVSRVIIRSGVDPATFTTVRVTGSALIFALWTACWRRQSLYLPRGRELLVLIGLGLAGVALLQWTYFVAVQRLPVGVALLLQFTAPVLVALWSRVVRKEAVRNRMWVAIGLSFVGLAVIAQVWEGMILDPVGVLAGFGAAIFMATYFLLGEHGVNTQDPMTVIVWAFLIAALALNIVHPVTNLSVGVAGTSTSLLGSLSGLSAPVWALIAWVIVMGTVVPFGLELYALQHLPATLVIMVAMLEPVGVNVLGWVWLDETLSPVQILGGVAVVTGIVLAQTARRQVEREPVPIC